MIAIAPAIDHLSLNITEDSHVRSSLTATFAALLEEMGPSNTGQNSAPMPMSGRLRSSVRGVWSNRCMRPSVSAVPARAHARPCARRVSL